jgi:hypothetical protein
VIGSSRYIGAYESGYRFIVGCSTDETKGLLSADCIGRKNLIEHSVGLKKD